MTGRRTKGVTCLLVGACVCATRAAVRGDDAPAAELPSLKLTLDPLAHQPSTPPALQSPAPSKPQSAGSRLTELSLEDLMNIEVTSVSKQKQRLGDAAAAVFVIGQDDIHRSGMTAIPDLLRMVPGLYVGQVDPGNWAVGSRGLTTARTNNLLVMVDGRTVYAPLFGGVYWDLVDYPLDDLERIEVVRGPGGTLWGSNAVNGVVSILTKSAEETQGLSVQDYTGTDGYTGSVRYGGKVDNQIFYRVYSKYRTMDNMSDPMNPRAIDGWDSLRDGFRVDAHLSPADLLTVQGDYAQNRAGQTEMNFSLAPPYARETNHIRNTTGGNLLARYTHTYSADSDLMVQAYFDNLQLTDFGNSFVQDTYDVEFQHRLRLAHLHEIIWGGGVRTVTDQIHALGPVLEEGTYADPTHRVNITASVFVQDDITLLPDRLHAIIGTKLELTPYTGLQVEPSARLLFTPDARNTLWTGVSRAVRTPFRTEEDAHLLAFATPTSTVPLVADYVGNRDLRPETTLAFEAGYRTAPLANLSFDLATFLNVHRDLMEDRPVGEPTLVRAPTPHLDLLNRPLNAAQGISYGAELSARWKATDQLTLSAGYSFLGVNLHSTMPGNDAGKTAGLAGSAPAHQAQARLSYDITKNIQMNAATYFVGTVEDPHTGSYFRQDLNLAWRFDKHAEVMIGVRNLLDGGRVEFLDDQIRSSGNEVPRTFFVQLQVTF